MTATLREAATAVQRAPKGERVNILLVDDRVENLLALDAILEPLGERLVRAHSGDEALKCLLTEEFAVILLDVQMPGLNGFETAGLIKSRERTRYVPIIFLTAISKDEQYVFRGYSVGAVDYMSKPFQPDVLRSKVAVFVDLYRKQRQIKQQERLLREAAVREVELEHRTLLLAQEARTAQIVSTAMDAIVVLDADRHIVMFNRAAERMFGVVSSDVVHRPVAELIRDNELDRALTTIAAAPTAATATSELHSLTGYRSNGERFPMEASVSCLDVGGDRSFTIIARDMTDRVRAEEALRTQAVSLSQNAAELRELNSELQRRQEELEHAMTARNRFYASMSHELRTPINAIIGYNTLLLDHIYGPLNDKQAHGLQRTHKAANHLLELVNDVLDLSKIEAGKIELTLQPVPFPGIIEDLFVTVRPLADEHETPLELRVDGAPKAIISDPRRVRQILLNLLSNAIKFGRSKPILVDVSLSADHIEVAVTDQGEGIESDDLPRIFDEFVQLSNSQQLGGTGLGLPISKRLATLVGGELEVTSERGKGSTFRLTLPERIGMDD